MFKKSFLDSHKLNSAERVVLELFKAVEDEDGHMVTKCPSWVAIKKIYHSRF